MWEQEGGDSAQAGMWADAGGASAPGADEAWPQSAGAGDSIEAGGGPAGALNDLFGRMYGEGAGSGGAGGGYDEAFTPEIYGPERMLPTGQRELQDHVNDLVERSTWDPGPAQGALAALGARYYRPE